MSTLSAFYKGGSITVCGDGQVIFAMEANALAFNEPLGADFRLSDNMLSKNQLLLFERIGFEECEKLRIAHARQKGLPEKEIRRIANEIRYSQARGEIPCYVISAYVSDGQL